MITSGFFDSLNGDRKYNSDQLSSMLEGLVGDGIYENVGNKFKVSAAGGMSVSIGSGRAVIKGHWIKSDSAYNLSVSEAEAASTRRDSVVLQYNSELRSIRIVLKKGSGTAAPTLENTENIKELCLARITIPANATRLTQSNITDMRGSSECGWVTGLINQVDTSELFEQYKRAYTEYYTKATTDFNKYMQKKESAFNAWYESLTGELACNTRLITYTKSQQVNSGISIIKFEMPEYTSDSDILILNLDGKILVENIDYTLTSSSDFTIVSLTEKTKAAGTITFTVIKATFDENAQAVTLSNAKQYTDSQINGITQSFYPKRGGTIGGNTELTQTVVHNQNTIPLIIRRGNTGYGSLGVRAEIGDGSAEGTKTLGYLRWGAEGNFSVRNTSDEAMLTITPSGRLVVNNIKTKSGLLLADVSNSISSEPLTVEIAGLTDKFTSLKVDAVLSNTDGNTHQASFILPVGYVAEGNTYMHSCRGYATKTVFFDSCIYCTLSGTALSFKQLVPGGGYVSSVKIFSL